ncbi:MAG: tetratricopeptide repeat protein [Azoarcus sp.]|jgi:predicted negative regulator of RcsB-dependent stress response|nr:tetratricopeptide repeat protein [Azoarcus sp.]
MAVYDLEEQEQIAEIKAWWNRYGNLVVSALLVVTLGFAGWSGWNRYQNAQAVEAGALYFELQQAVAAGNTQRVRELAGTLISNYGGTLQAQLGAMLSGGLQFRMNDSTNARPQLEWATKEGKDPALRDLARLRLATVLLNEKEMDAALACLQPMPEGPWRVRFEDLRGDALAAQGKAAEARAAWRAAVEALDKGDGGTGSLRDLIRDKLESLEG